jgi:hypothetical protein
VVIASVGLLTALKRAPEIAVHRVEGATRRDVMAQFLAAGLVLSVAGALLGWALGCGLAELRIALEPLAGMTWAFPWGYALVTLLVSVVVGCGATPYRPGARPRATRWRRSPMSSLLAAFVEGVRHLGRHPLRAALAALTCAVAIAVTVNVVSLSYGMDEDVRRDIARFGRLTIDVGRAPVVRPGAPRASFGEAELATVRATVAGLDATVVPLRSERVTAAGDAEVRQMVLAAVGVGFPRTLAIALGPGGSCAPTTTGSPPACSTRARRRACSRASRPPPSSAGRSGWRARPPWTCRWWGCSRTP